MPRTRARRRGEGFLLADLETLLHPVRRVTVFGRAWWWRYELGLLIATSLGLTLLVREVGVWWAVGTVSAIIGAFGPWPPAHRLFIAAAWRIITPHRLRAGFVEARIQSRNGRIPSVLRCTQQPFGERVQLWCPAGTSVEDLRAAVSILRTACWAADIRVMSHDRHAQLVTLDVIRDRAGHTGRRTEPRD
jgi:hypothetical protein